MPEHTIKAFDTELQDIARMIAEMGALVEKQIAAAGTALMLHDVDAARHIIPVDLEVDKLQQEIEHKTVLTIARRQPMALDLRETIAALRIVGDLERMGDSAKSIAKRVISGAGEHSPAEALHALARIIERVRGALRQVLDAYTRRDVERALGVWRADQAIDAEVDALMRELIAQMTADPRKIPICTDLLFCAKSIERFGDHATNIAETVYYMVEGKVLDAERPKSSAVQYGTPARS